MAEQKYKINESILDTEGGVAKLERDGFNREVIHRQMYRVTEGASTAERREIMKKLYNRRKPC